MKNVSSFVSEQKKQNRNEVLCPDVDSLIIQGQFTDEEYAYIEIDIKSCDASGSVKCANLADINGKTLAFGQLKTSIDLDIGDNTLESQTERYIDFFDPIAILDP